MDTPFLVSQAAAVLESPGGGVTIAAAGATAISTARAECRGLMQRLEAICLVAPTAAGTFTLRTGATVLRVLQQPLAAGVIGTRYVWDFASPLQSNSGGTFTIDHSGANQGTWTWNVNGFYYPG